MSGWIKIHRSLLKKAYFKNQKKLTLWIYLLLKANHEERDEALGGKKIKCKPGQFTTGRRQIAADLGISESYVEKLLNFLQKEEHQIDQLKTSTNRLITILKWKQYQGGVTTKRQQKDNRVTTKRHTIRSKEDSNTIVRNSEKKIKNNGSEIAHSSIYQPQGGTVLLDRYAKAGETYLLGETNS